MTCLKSQFRELLLNDKRQFHIVTFNLDFYYNVSKNRDFYNICANADLVVPDGYGIISLLNLKYKEKINRITGNQLFILLLELADELGLRAAFVGSSDQVQMKLKEKINRLFPSINIVSSISPIQYFENYTEESNTIIEELGSAKPDIVFVGLSSPRQVVWIDQIRELVNSKIYIGVGAAFDYFTGSKKRAPLLIQSIGLEWLWRVLFEPKRLFKRYIINDLPFYFKKYLSTIGNNTNE